jgi:hypothetical protein
VAEHRIGSVDDMTAAAGRDVEQLMAVSRSINAQLNKAKAAAEGGISG